MRVARRARSERSIFGRDLILDGRFPLYQGARAADVRSQEELGQSVAMWRLGVEEETGDIWGLACGCLPGDGEVESAPEAGEWAPDKM